MLDYCRTPEWLFEFNVQLCRQPTWWRYLLAGVGGILQPSGTPDVKQLPTNQRSVSPTASGRGDMCFFASEISGAPAIQGTRMVGAFPVARSLPSRVMAAKKPEVTA